MNAFAKEFTSCEPLPLGLMREFSFALISPGQSAKLPDGVASKVLVTKELADSVEWLPHLINLRELSTDQSSALLELLDAQSQDDEPPVVCAWLKSEGDPERVHQHLSRAQVQRGPGDARAWLRLHDPRVWLQLPRVLDGKAMSALFGPVSEWAVQYGGAWHVSQPSQARRKAGAIRHDAIQWEAMLRIGAVNRALAALGFRSQKDALEASTALDTLIERARQNHGLSRVEDQVAFAVFGWRTHELFDQHHLVQEGLAAAKHEVPPVELVDVLSRLTPTQQQSIRADLGGTAQIREHL